MTAARSAISAYCVRHMTKQNMTILQRQHVRAGTTLIEVVVTVCIFAMIGLIFAQTFALAAAHVADARMRDGAIAVATQQMEQLRNLTYDAVAVQGGVPNGTIDPDTTVTLGHRTYRVQTDVRYVDDPDDGTIDSVPQDTVPTDYKNVQVDVTWGDASPTRHVRLTSLFAPPGIENTAGGGTMVINVFDAEGAPIRDASVHIANTTTQPPISVTAFSDAAGRVLVPGAPAAQDYGVSVQKDGYEAVTTYPAYPGSSFYPHDENVTVTENTLVTLSLMSSKLATVGLVVQDPYGTATSDVSLTVVGGRVLGTTPGGESVYGLDHTYTSAADGTIDMGDRAAGSYTVTAADARWRVFLVDDPTTPQPHTFAVSQDTTPTYTVTVVDTTIPSVIVAVADAVTNAPLIGADVTLANADASYNVTAQTNAYGEVYFPVTQDAPLPQGTYTLTAAAAGYDAQSSQIVVGSGLENVDAKLTPQ